MSNLGKKAKAAVTTPGCALYHATQSARPVILLG